MARVRHRGRRPRATQRLTLPTGFRLTTPHDGNAALDVVSLDGLPAVAGAKAPIQTLLSEQCTLLVIGDSTTSAMLAAMFREWKLNLAGVFINGANHSTNSPTAQTITAHAYNDPGSTIYANTGYSFADSLEMVTGAHTFTGIGDGGPIGLQNRIAGATGNGYLTGTRANLATDATDWLTAHHITAQSLCYTDPTNMTQSTRIYTRGSDTNAAYKTNATAATLYSAAPGYSLLTHTTYTGNLGAADLYVEAQFLDAAITAGKHWNLIGTMLRTTHSQPSVGIIDISSGGASAGTYTATDNINQAAWSAALQAYGVTHCIIALGINSTDDVSEYQDLHTRVRTAVPNVQFIHITPHDCYRLARDGTPNTKLANAQHLYAATDLSADTWINLHGTMGTEAKITANSGTSDGIHPVLAFQTAKAIMARKLAQQLIDA